MNEQDARTTPPDGEFEPHRLRSITDMLRSRDDRWVAGVCAGAARHLNIDPVILRVVLVVLTFVGFAGPILYLAAWFLIPSEDEDKSIAADWLRLDRNEEQVRVAGLVGALVLAMVAVVGDSGWFWDGAPWILLPLALLFYLFAVLPRRRRERRDTAVAEPARTPYDPPGAPGSTDTLLGATRPPLAGPRPPRRRRSWALTGLTASFAAIAIAALLIYSEYREPASWTTYVAVALGAVGVGLLISTFVGDGGPLIAIGLLLALVLAVGSILPSGRIGAQRPVPVTAAQVDSTYRHGIGLLELDLTGVDDPDALLGRTVELEAAVGQVKVLVPEGLNVEVDAHLGAGEISVLGRKVNGTDNELDQPAGLPGPALTLDIHHKLGNIEVIRR